jgi:myo-inositol-1-phosphate synthase
VVIDALRCLKIARDRGLVGSLVAPSSYFMKSPHIQYSDDECRRRLEQFIAGGEQSKPIILPEHA